MKTIILAILVLTIMTFVVLFSGFGVSAATLGKIVFYGLLVALMVKAVPPLLEKR